MPGYLSLELFSEWMTAISAPLTPLSLALSSWMEAYDAVPLAALDVSASPVTTSEQLTTVIISLARNSLGCDEADILLGASPPPLGASPLPLHAPLPSALPLSGLSLPSAATIDAERIHHGGGAIQQIEQVTTVRLQAVARGLLAWRRLQEMRWQIRNREAVLAAVAFDAQGRHLDPLDSLQQLC
jgi:hypothetical protein